MRAEEQAAEAPWLAIPAAAAQPGAACRATRGKPRTPQAAAWREIRETPEAPAGQAEAWPTDRQTAQEVPGGAVAAWPMDQTAELGARLAPDWETDQREGPVVLEEQAAVWRTDRAVEQVATVAPAVAWETDQRVALAVRVVPVPAWPTDQRAALEAARLPELATAVPAPEAALAAPAVTGRGTVAAAAWQAAQVAQEDPAAAWRMDPAVARATARWQPRETAAVVPERESVAWVEAAAVLVEAVVESVVMVPAMATAAVWRAEPAVRAARAVAWPMSRPVARTVAPWQPPVTAAVAQVAPARVWAAMPAVPAARAAASAVMTLAAAPAPFWREMPRHREPAVWQAREIPQADLEQVAQGLQTVPAARVEAWPAVLCNWSAAGSAMQRPPSRHGWHGLMWRQVAVSRRSARQTAIRRCVPRRPVLSAANPLWWFRVMA